METNGKVQALASKHAPPGQRLAIHELYEDCYAPNLLPMSWGAGLFLTAIRPLYVEGMVPIMVPAARTLTAAYVDEMNRLVPRGKKNGIVLVPDLLRQLVRNAEYQEGLKRYDWIAYAGAPLDHPTGDLLAALVPRLQSFIGSTDTGIYPLLLNHPADWKIHRLHPDLDGYFLEHFSEDLYELCVRRQPHDPRYAFAGHPEVEVYHTKDLWRKVPGRESYFSSAGRVDDFVKLSSMTKFNAITIEQLIERNVDVGKCLVGGDDRPRPFAIVEPAAHITADSDVKVKDTVAFLWPAFEVANEHLLPEARMTKELTLVADPLRPIKRTAKGTVDRRSTIKLYEAEIEAIYEKAGFPRKSSDMVNGVY